MKALAVVGVLALVVVAGTGCNDDGDALGPGPVTVRVELHHSRFSPARLRVVEGTVVRFVVRNTDPIDHELIVGDAEVHERHEHGSEPRHGDKPGEVSVPAGATGETTYRFDEPGAVVMACHLPRHLAFGMRGEVTVVER